MQTSPVFDEIRAEGRAEGIRASILRLGSQKYGRAPSKKQRLALEAITNRAQLDKVIERLLDVQSWTDLLKGA